MLFLFFAEGLFWRFATYDTLSLKCSVCRRIVDKSRNGTSDFHPVNGSFCDANPDDDFCTFISDVVIGVKQVRNLDDFCTNIYACPQKTPKGRVGYRCQICLFLVSHLLIHKKEDRRTAFDLFCRTNRVHPISFCGDIIDEGLDGFLHDVSAAYSALEACESYQYCRSKSDEL
jgi:hypothetical protein